MPRPSKVSSLFGAWIMTAGIFCLPGCGDDGGDEKGDGDDVDFSKVEIPTTPAAGKIAGQAWTALAAWGNVTETDGTLSFDIVGKEKPYPCDVFSGGIGNDGPKILGTVPREVGEHLFSIESGRLMTFAYQKDGESQNVFSPGKIKVESVSDTELKAGLVVKFDGDHEVSGQVTIEICKDKYSPDQDFPAETLDDPSWRGSWTAPQIILGSASGWKWKTTSSAANTFRTTLVTDGGDVIEDADETWRFDLESTPKRIIREVTKVHASVNGLKKVGNKEYCLYESVAAASPASFRVECGTSSWPLEFPSPPDETWTKEP